MKKSLKYQQGGVPIQPINYGDNSANVRANLIRKLPIKDQPVAVLPTPPPIKNGYVPAAPLPKKDLVDKGYKGSYKDMLKEKRFRDSMVYEGNRINATDANSTRSLIPAPMNVAQMLAKKTGNARMDQGSLDDDQKLVLWNTIHNAAKRTGKPFGGTEYSDYASKYGTKDEFNDWFNRGKLNAVDLGWNSVMNEGFKVASTVGRGHYYIDPETQDAIYTDVYDWNTHENNFKGDGIYQSLRNSVRAGEDKNLNAQKNEDYRMNFVLHKADMDKAAQQQQANLDKAGSTPFGSMYTRSYNTGYQQGGSTTGYLPNSPDRFNPYNIIPSNTITMNTVPHDVLGIANTGEVKRMKKNSGLHKFVGADSVTEYPMYNIGGELPNSLPYELSMPYLQVGGTYQRPPTFPLVPPINPSTINIPGQHSMTIGQPGIGHVPRYEMHGRPVYIPPVKGQTYVDGTEGNMVGMLDGTTFYPDYNNVAKRTANPAIDMNYVKSYLKSKGLANPNIAPNINSNMVSTQQDGGCIECDEMKDGGHWIQKAVSGMRKDHPCTGSKFGGPSCPPGSKRYNLAKTFRHMNKQMGGSINPWGIQDPGYHLYDGTGGVRVDPNQMGPQGPAITPQNGYVQPQKKVNHFSPNIEGAAGFIEGLSMFGSNRNERTDASLYNNAVQRGTSDSQFQTYNPVLKRGFIDPNTGMTVPNQQTPVQFGNKPYSNYYGSPFIAQGGMELPMMGMPQDPTQSINNQVDAGLPPIPYNSPLVQPQQQPAQQENASISPSLIDFIKKQEGFDSKAFWDHKQFTVGYGTKAKAPGEVISKKEAEQRLLEEVMPLANRIKSSVKVPLTESQMTALTSIGYNAGYGNVKKIINRINKGADPKEISDIIRGTATTVDNGARVLNGLVSRRQREAKLFMQPYKVGGEYDLSHEQIQQLRDQGYDVEFI